MAWNILQGDKDAKPKFTVAICIPHRGLVTMDFAFTLAQLQKPAAYFMSGERGHQIATSRNLQVTGAMARGAQYIFFMDSDMHFPSDIMMALLNLSLPIVSGVYYNRAPPYHMMAQIDGMPLDHKIAGTSEVRQVSTVGFGCCLVDIRVFHRIGATLPWRCLKNHTPEIKKVVNVMDYKQAKEQGFRCQYCKQPLVAPFFNTTLGFVDDDPQSEDYYFCSLARKMGFPIFVKLDAICKHELFGMTVGQEGITNNTKVIGEGQS